ncbi:MAG: hypothetical protein L3K17_02860 [Thermoplasmata archaeon]|nr:hypothetical protein [Thermoplasmata archaeon]
MSASRLSVIPSAEGRTRLFDGRTAAIGIPARGWRPSRRHALTVLGTIGLVALFLVPSSMELGAPHLVATGGASHPQRESPAAQLAAAHLAASLGQGPGRAAALPAVPRTASAPSSVYSLSMVYDAADGYVVAVNPNSSGGLYNVTYGSADLTWIYAGGNWTVTNTTGAPPELLYPGLVYDAADGYVLLFGGLIVAGTLGELTGMVYSNQTWSYAAGVWTNRTSPTAVQPAANEPPQLTYDGADGYVLLYDEAVTAPDTQADTTWTYLAGVWTNISGPASAPVPPIAGSMAYDAADGYVVYFGSLTSGPGIENWWTLNTTWKFLAGSWTNITANVTGAPSGRADEAITYDSGLGELVVFGGMIWRGPYNFSAANDTWAYAAGTWTNLNLTTPATSWWTTSLAFDPASGQLLLAGETTNTTNSSAASSIWLLGNRSWTPEAPLLLLANLGADVGVPFGLQVRSAPHSGVLSYRYANLPPGCTSVNAPTLTCVTGLSGRYVIDVTVTDTIGDSTTLVTTVAVNPRPVIVSFGASSPLSEIGVPITLTAVANGGTGVLSYAYGGLPNGCVTADAATIVCTPASAGPALVVAQVSDGLGVTSTSSVTVAVAARPSVTTFVAVPNVVDVGQTAVLAALTAGGVGPDAYAFSDLPAGCATVDQLSFGCAPTVAGSYRVSILATDSLGIVTSGTADLTVNPVPSITTFRVSDTQSTVGTALAFSLSFIGGTAPYTYLYTGLPAGCATTDSMSVQCTATAPGNYTVSGTVTDATGATATQALIVEVTAVPVTHPSSPGSGFSASGGAGESMFWFGLVVGSLGVIAVAWSARRESRARSEGEAIVTQLRETSQAQREAGGASASAPRTPSDPEIL